MPDEIPAIIEAQLPIRQGGGRETWPEWLPTSNIPTHQMCQAITESSCCGRFAGFIVKSSADKTWSCRTCSFHTLKYSAPSYTLLEFWRDSYYDQY